MSRKKLISRGYTAFIALLCTASVAFAIHANGEAAKAEGAAAKARDWERYARATRIHRKQTAHSLSLLIQRYNTLARRATAEQGRLLASLSEARRRAAAARPSGASPVVYRSTQSMTISQPAAIQPAAPPASAAPAAPSSPTTKTS